MVTFADIVPTILEFAGADGPDYSFPGRLFLSVLGDTNPEGWDEIYESHTFHEITMYYPMCLIRTRRYSTFLTWLMACLSRSHRTFTPPQLGKELLHGRMRVMAAER